MTTVVYSGNPNLVVYAGNHFIWCRLFPYDDIFWVYRDDVLIDHSEVRLEDLYKGTFI